MRYNPSNFLIPFWSAVVLVFGSCEHDPPVTQKNVSSHDTIKDRSNPVDTNQYILFDTVPSNTVFETDPNTEFYQKLYGKWKMLGVGGGITGENAGLPSDYIEFKPNGLYAVTFEKKTFLLGYFYPDTFHRENWGLQYGQVKMVKTQVISIPDKYVTINGHTDWFSPSAPTGYFYVEFNGDRLILKRRGSDTSAFHFEKDQ